MILETLTWRQVGMQQIRTSWDTVAQTTLWCHARNEVFSGLDHCLNNKKTNWKKCNQKISMDHFKVTVVLSSVLKTAYRKMLSRPVRFFFFFLVQYLNGQLGKIGMPPYFQLICSSENAPMATMGSNIRQKAQECFGDQPHWKKKYITTNARNMSFNVKWKWQLH